ncbi:hypothetical protein QJS66_19840 [Kocuria rhizophila]|nr:hypothetical protein QJS66_19840 [Kocuria rhizophila]
MTIASSTAAPVSCCCSPPGSPRWTPRHQISLWSRPSSWCTWTIMAGGADPGDPGPHLIDQLTQTWRRLPRHAAVVRERVRPGHGGRSHRATP